MRAAGYNVPVQSISRFLVLNNTTLKRNRPVRRNHVAAKWSTGPLY